ncbi:hypothetical protein [Streptomyces sp. NPDC007984]|uniref:hypothetical protein n=1 Tax=Streptomyces sp. NPDC007984 TaxID=3364801 RepID=UPI0036E74140
MTRKQAGHPALQRSFTGEGRSEQELAIEAIRDAQDRAELKVDDVLAELMDSDAEILDYLK